MAMQDFLIWPGGSDPGMTHGSLEMRRRIAERLMSQKRPFPKTKGEGMTYLGESIGEGLMLMQLSQQERAYKQQQQAALRDTDPSNYATTPPSPTAAPPPSPVMPVTPTAPPPANVPQADTGGGSGDIPIVGAGEFNEIDAAAPPAPAPVAEAEPPPPSVLPTTEMSSKGDMGPLTPEAVDEIQLRQSRAASAEPQGVRDSIAKTLLSQAQGQAPLPPQDPATAPPEEGGFNAIDAAADAPPERAIDRSRFKPELAANPALVGKAAAMVRGEVGLGRDPVRERIQLESAFNRAQGRNHSLDQALLSVAEHPKKGYYARDTYRGNVTPQQMEYFQKYVYEPVVGGSDEGTKFLGSPVTGNASQDFAQRRLDQGVYANGKWYGTPGGSNEMFVTEKGDAARLAQNPLPLLSGEAAPTQVAQNIPSDQPPTRMAQAAPGPGPARGIGGEAAMPGEEPQPVQTAFDVAAPQEADAEDDARLADVTGTRPGAGRPMFPATASLGRAGVATDAPVPGLAPMGGPIAEGVSKSLEARRNAIAEQLTPPPPAVPQAEPTPAAAADPMGVQPTMVDFSPAPMGPGQQFTQARQAPVQPPMPPMPPAQQQPPPAAPASQLPPAPEQFKTPPVKPEPPRYMDMHPAEARGNALIRTTDDPQVQKAAERLIAYGKSQRDLHNASETKRYDTGMTVYNDQLKSWQEYERKRPETEIELRGKQQDLLSKQSAQAMRDRLGGQDPDKWFETMRKEKLSAQQAANTVDASRLALKAMKAGVITGSMADLRVDAAKMHSFMLDNKMSGDVAANTEVMKAALTAAIGGAIRTLQPQDTRVTDADIKLASKAAGADPNMQLGAIRQLLDASFRVNHSALSDYESKREHFLSGTNAHRDFQFATQPTAPQPYVDALLKRADNADIRAKFDERYGVGAAQLEIDRAQRRAQYGGR